jgi:hypothetical protein
VVQSFPQERDGRRHRFTREECQRGYRAALEKCMEDRDLYAWFYYRIRGYYREVKRNGKKGKGTKRAGRSG